MPALDKFQLAVHNALQKDGWTITNEPLSLRYEGQDVYIDLAAERLLSAEKGTRKIAVEIKTFTGRSQMADLHQAVGQYLVYQSVLNQMEPERELYLAVTEVVYQGVFTEAIGALVLHERINRIFTFDPEQEEIVRWLPL